MAEDGECKTPTEIGATCASRLPIASTDMVKSSITDGGSSIQEIDMNKVHLDAAPQTGTSHKRIIKGTFKFLQSLSELLSYTQKLLGN